jgi:hypothetical protein
MQSYPSPWDVIIPEIRPVRSDKIHRKIIWHQGLIVPILVVKNSDGVFEAFDRFEAERVQTCRELSTRYSPSGTVGFSTILVEDDFEEDEW